MSVGLVVIACVVLVLISPLISYVPIPLLDVNPVQSPCFKLLSALLRCSTSSFSRWWLEQTVLALCLRVLIINEIK